MLCLFDSRYTAEYTNKASYFTEWDETSTHRAVGCYPATIGIYLLKPIVFRDQFARQRKLDKFKARPFADAFKSSSVCISVYRLCAE
jgi:hypothetical protein